MLKRFATKINSCIDKAIELRDRMFLRSMLLLFMMCQCYFYSYLYGPSTLISLISIVSIVSFIYTFAVAGAIFYVQLFILTKIEAIHVGGRVADAIVGHAKDMVIKKARSLNQ